MKKSIIIFMFLLFSAKVIAQNASQTLRGEIIDSETKFPLPFASVGIFKDSSLIKSVMSDSTGRFRFDGIVPGKYSLRVNFIGYSPLFNSGVVVNSGKETVLTLEMQESNKTLTEVEIVGFRKDQSVNEMSMISTRTFSVEEANRYAGSRGDPGRMATNYAGVQGSDDTRNDIIIRGNSPLGVLWRINGTTVANPNHFAIPGTTGGGVTMLNNKTLANSDFMTGAFSAEYGNTISGVFDLRFRNGNNEKHEYTAQLGFLGTELTGEGPISRKNHSSYLFAYRYSTLKLFESFKIPIGTDAIPNYQDISAKLNFPGKKGGNLYFYAIGGMSDINIKISEKEDPETELYGEKDKDQLFKTSSGLVGVGKAFNFNPSLYAQVKLSYQRGGASAEDGLVFRNENYVVDSIVPCLGYKFQTGTTSISAEVVKKFSPSLVFKSGINYDILNYDLIDSVYNENDYTFTTRLDYKGNTSLIQPYALVKSQIGEKLSITAGIHLQILTLNKSQSFEPRVGIKYAVSEKSYLSAGFGMHSQMQPYYIYYHLTKNSDGNYVQQNHDLSFTRSNHYIISYDHSLRNNSRIRIEGYYQNLYEVPVTIESSSYSIVNEGAVFTRFFPEKLANEGTGHNTGIELTVEKFFSKSYYFLFTGSLFESKYKGSDGIERSTSFDGRFNTNLLAGKDIAISKNSILQTGFKLIWGGGKRYSPVDTAASHLAGDLVEDDSLRNSLQFPDYFRFDLKVGIKINSKKFTHEFALDLLNVFGNKNILSLTYVYDPRHPEVSPVKKQYQLGFLPIFYYKIEFGI